MCYVNNRNIYQHSRVITSIISCSFKTHYYFTIIFPLGPSLDIKIHCYPIGGIESFL